MGREDAVQDYTKSVDEITEQKTWISKEEFQH